MEDGDREILENADIIGKLRSKGNSISILQKLKKCKSGCVFWFYNNLERINNQRRV